LNFGLVEEKREKRITAWEEDLDVHWWHPTAAN